MRLLFENEKVEYDPVSVREGLDHVRQDSRRNLLKGLRLHILRLTLRKLLGKRQTSAAAELFQRTVRHDPGHPGPQTPLTPVFKIPDMGIDRHERILQHVFHQRAVGHITRGHRSQISHIALVQGTHACGISTADQPD